MYTRRCGVCVVATAAALCACGDDARTDATAQSAASSGAGASGGGGSTPSSSGSGGAGGTGGEGGAPAAPFSLLAWNLEQFPHSSSAAEKVAATIGELGVAVVAVSEVDDIAAFDALAASMPGYQATVASDGDGFVRVGLLHDATRVTLSEIETLFDDDSYRFPRPPLKAHVTLTDGGFDFDVVVIHLKAQLDDESQARRKAACEALDEWVRTRLDQLADPDIVLAGDFNDEIDDPPEWNVFGAFLGAPEVYSFLTQPVSEAGDFSYIPFESLIDHVLVTTSVLGPYGSGVTEAVHLERSVPSYVDDVSDHRPVLSRFAAVSD
jgi:endonuclease/exonuclease/phosphatase family metal-dependent hydrolase